MSLGPPLATKILQKFETDDVKLLMQSASSLGKVNKDDLELIVDQFAAQFAKTLGLSTDYQQVRSLMEQAFAPEKLNSMLDDVPPAPGEPVWHKFGSGSENALVPYLLDEHPQTVTFVLSSLNADLAARCLSMLPRETRETVARRMLKLRPAGDMPSQILQERLQRDLLSRDDAGADDASRIRVASIINKLDRDQADAILNALTSTQPEEARKLRGLVFSFDDISKLDQRHRLAIFDKVATEQAIAALRGTTPEFRELVLQSMGARARRMVEAELTSDNGQVTREVLAARRAIADLALAMAQRGDIALPASGEQH